MNLSFPPCQLGTGPLLLRCQAAWEKGRGKSDGGKPGLRDVDGRGTEKSKTVSVGNGEASEKREVKV